MSLVFLKIQFSKVEERSLTSKPLMCDCANNDIFNFLMLAMSLAIH